MINSSRMSVSNHNASKKRLCPKCCEPLKAVTVGNNKSKDSNGRSSKFSTNGSYMNDNMKSYQTMFQCVSCRMSYTLEDLEKIDQSNQKS